MTPPGPRRPRVRSVDRRTTERRSTERGPAERRPAGSSVVAARERFERRARRARRRPKVIAALAGLVLLLGLLGYVVVWRSDVLDVRDVTVSGVSGEEATRALAAAGIPTGRAVMGVDTAGAARRVARLPYVESVFVGRRLPHTVTVDITPRRPAVVLQDAKGQLQVAGNDGRPIRNVAAAPDGLPILSVRPGGQATGGVVAAVEESRRALPAGLVHTMGDLSVGPQGGLSFTVDSVGGRRTVLWGEAGAGADRKGRAVQALTQERGGSVIDVRTPDAPVLR